MNAADIEWANTTEAWEEYLAYFGEDDLALKNSIPPNVQIVEVDQRAGVVRAVVDGEFLLTARSEGLFQSEYALEACDHIVAGERVVVEDLAGNQRINVSAGLAGGVPFTLALLATCVHAAHGYDRKQRHAGNTCQQLVP